ncbi:transcription elongation factor GreA [Candidatus Saccharibacteria bacterium]|nr:transcription elongation factor GreA [Candidatus Saccharibacteria bacterium]
MVKEFRITKQGKKALEDERDELTSQRGEIAERLASARSQGDLTENAEFDSAKNDQQVLEKRVTEIENILKNHEIIEEKKSDVVSLGSKVGVQVNGKDFEYQVVGKVEANPSERRISDESPIGSSLLNHKVGDEVSVELEAGTKNYKITAIK